MDVAYDFLRSAAARDSVRVTHVSTEDNAADMFTKPLAEVELSKFKLMIGNM